MAKVAREAGRCVVRRIPTRAMPGALEEKSRLKTVIKHNACAVEGAPELESVSTTGRGNERTSEFSDVGPIVAARVRVRPRKDRLVIPIPVIQQALRTSKGVVAEEQNKHRHWESAISHRSRCQSLDCLREKPQNMRTKRVQNAEAIESFSSSSKTPPIESVSYSIAEDCPRSACDSLLSYIIKQICRAFR
jgi:hypothetical protein